MKVLYRSARRRRVKFSSTFWKKVVGCRGKALTRPSQRAEPFRLPDAQEESGSPSNPEISKPRKKCCFYYTMFAGGCPAGNGERLLNFLETMNENKNYKEIKCRFLLKNTYNSNLEF